MPPSSINPETNHPETQMAVLIGEGLKRKGISLQKLSDVSGIAIKHLEHMSGGNIDKLPPAPYLRSYLAIIGQILDFDGTALWERIRVDELAVGAGKSDRLPGRESHFSFRTKIIWIAGAAILLGLYLFFRLPDIVGQPSLEIGFPSETISTVGISPVTLIGSLKNGDEFSINGERVPLGQDGLWQKSIDLQEGMNTIELKGNKFLGGEIRVLRQIIYTPSSSSTIKDSASSTEETNVSSTEKTPNTSSTNNVSSSKKKATSSNL